MILIAGILIMLGLWMISNSIDNLAKSILESKDLQNEH